MRTSDMIKSKFLGVRDVQGQRPLVLTIAHVTEELFTRGSAPDMQYFVWFQEHTKGLKLNKTRIGVLEAAYGPDSDLWTGGRVRLSFDPTVKFGGVAVGAVRIETPPGVVYQAHPGHPGWGDPPQRTAAPPGAPPAPVWDAQRQVWVTSQPIAAPEAPARPPPPVWNGATQAWETVNPATGEIGNQSARPPPTISQRVNEGHPPERWGEGGPPPGEAPPDFDDEIPF